MGLIDASWTALLIEGIVLLAIGTRELLTGLTVGCLLCWGLGALAILNAWAIARRQAGRRRS